MSSHHNGAVIYVSDLERLQQFYERICGLTVEEAAGDFVTFTADGWQLHLIAVPERIAERIEVASPPVRRTETPIKLIFEVDDLEQTRAAVAALGGVVDGPEHEWRHGDARVCDGHDPEGNVVQFRVATARRAAFGAPAGA